MTEVPVPPSAPCPDVLKGHVRAGRKDWPCQVRGPHERHACTFGGVLVLWQYRHGSLLVQWPQVLPGDVLEGLVVGCPEALIGHNVRGQEDWYCQVEGVHDRHVSGPPGACMTWWYEDGMTKVLRDFSAPPPGYRELPGGMLVLGCEGCGSLVVDTVAHDRKCSPGKGGSPAVRVAAAVAGGVVVRP